jgi:hypothetical protein
MRVSQSQLCVRCRSTLRSGHPDAGGPGAAGPVFAGWRQGFLSNITNPKVLVFYLAVLPQFLTATAGPGWLLAFAWSHAVLSLGYLLAPISPPEKSALAKPARPSDNLVREAGLSQRTWQAVLPNNLSSRSCAP